MTTRNPATGPSKQSRSSSGIKTPAPAKKAPAQRGADSTEKPARAAKEDKERSDWEGMAPRPEQGSDDVAAPGQTPEAHP